MPLPAGEDLWEHVLRDQHDRDITPRFRATIAWLRAHHVFPEAYIYSAAYAKQTARGRASFVDGRTNLTDPGDPDYLRGIPRFFLYTMLYKTPLPLFGLLVAAACSPLVTRGGRTMPEGRAMPEETTEPAANPTWRRVGRGLYASAPLWIFFVIYWGASLNSNLNIGHRHVMPTYPVLFVLCGANLLWLGRRSAIARAVPVLLIALFVGASVWIYPNYLAYFNRIAGGPKAGYRHLVDSSLDWGQDLPGLARYLERRKTTGGLEPVYLSYFGSGASRDLAPKHYGIAAESLPGRLAPDATGAYALQPGLFAISATNLQQIYTGLRWNAELEAEYQRLREVYERFAKSDDTVAARRAWATPQNRKALNRYFQLRFGRLSAYLRNREPDDWVNYSILIYDLDAQELDEALTSAL